MGEILIQLLEFPCHQYLTLYILQRKELTLKSMLFWEKSYEFRVHFHIVELFKLRPGYNSILKYLFLC